MAPPRVTLGGVVLGGDVTRSGYEWELRAGTSPVERLWVVSKHRAAQIKLPGPHEFRIESDRGTATFSELYVVEILPGALPGREQDVTLRVVDRRWKWARKWVATTLNLRRLTGETRLVNAAQVDNAVVVPEVEYARWSLYPPEAPSEPWTAATALRWLIEEQLETPLRIEGQLPEVAIESLALDDNGTDAVERLLAYLPGAALFIDPEGNAVAYDTQDASAEAGLVKRLSTRPYAGAVRIVDREYMAPREYVVHFTPEVELRLDYEESATGSGGRNEDTPTLRAVARVPDAELEITDAEGNTRTVARNTWVEQYELFNAWGPFGIYNEPVSFNALRCFAFKFGWAGFEHGWGNTPLQPPNVQQALRARTAAACYRTFFRLDRFFWQRIESIAATRIAVLDTVSGTYAPAEAFSDWTRRPSFRGQSYQNDPNTNHGWAHRGWAALLSDADVAPVSVAIADPQSGVIQLVQVVADGGHVDRTVLGYPEDGILPKQSGLAAANRSGMELYARWDRVVLEAGWRLSIVLTVVPGSPNTTERLPAVTIPAADVGVPGSGPPLHLRVFPGVATARYYWTDEHGQLLVDAIKGGASFPEVALFNRGQLFEVALATAKRASESFRARPIGTVEGAIADDLLPTGALESVRHRLEPTGVVTTAATFRAARVPADIWRYLNASTRRALMGVLNRPGQA